MNATSTNQDATAHVVACTGCAGSGRHVGTRCCGGQGCSSCDRDCDACGGVGSVAGYICRGEVVSAERAEELHETDACPVEACESCRVEAEREPLEDDGEGFRGGEAAAFQRERMTEAQRLK